MNTTTFNLLNNPGLNRKDKYLPLNTFLLLQALSGSVVSLHQGHDNAQSNSWVFKMVWTSVKLLLHFACNVNVTAFKI